MSLEANWPFDTVFPHSEDSSVTFTTPTTFDSETTYTDQDGAIVEFITVYERHHDDLVETVNELYDDRFVESATGRELEKLASEVGLDRQTGESDDRLRFRTQIAKAITRSSGNIYELATLFRILFGEDATNITLTPAENQPVVIMNVPDLIVDQIPVSVSVLEDLLSQALPSSDNLEIITGDTFAFDGQTTGGGFNEGTWA